MPEESINIFITNIYTVAIFTGVFLFIFLILFLISKRLNTRAKNIKSLNQQETDSIFSREPAHKNSIPDKYGSTLFRLGKDTSLIKTLFTLSLIFIFILFFLLIIILTFHFTLSFKMDGGFYLIFLLIFIIFVSAVYAIKSGIIK